MEVNPGMVFTSRTKGLESLLNIISAREKKKQPSPLCARKAADLSACIVFSGTLAGTIYSV